MPPFLPSRVSDTQAKELLEYIIKVMDRRKPAPACDVAIPKIVVRTEPASVAKGKQLFEANCVLLHNVLGTNARGARAEGYLKRKTLPFGDWPAIPENIFKQLKCPYAEMPSFKEKLRMRRCRSYLLS